MFLGFLSVFLLISVINFIWKLTYKEGNELIFFFSTSVLYFYPSQLCSVLLFDPVKRALSFLLETKLLTLGSKIPVMIS